MKFEFTVINDHLNINAEGVEETSTSFELAMGTVFKGDKGDKGDKMYFLLNVENFCLYFGI